MDRKERDRLVAMQQVEAGALTLGDARAANRNRAAYCKPNGLRSYPSGYPPLPLTP